MNAEKENQAMKDKYDKQIERLSKFSGDAFRKQVEREARIQTKG